MEKRYVSIWFRYLKTDWYSRRDTSLTRRPFVLYQKQQGRMVVSAANAPAAQYGINVGTAVADARSLAPGLEVREEPEGFFEKLISRFATWFLRYTPVVAVDGVDGLLLDATGCAHLWQGEDRYLQHMSQRLNQHGYTVSLAMAGTPGCAWAFARFGASHTIIKPGGEEMALQPFPPECLRIEADVTERLHKLGLSTIGQFMCMPGGTLRRRFGPAFLLRLQQAMGFAPEYPEPIEPPAEYAERLHCFDPIVTRPGIEIALQQLLDRLCNLLEQAGQGLRKGSFTIYRTDGKRQSLGIGTTTPSTQANHLFKLFELSLHTLEPGLGIELFVLEATVVQPWKPVQKKAFDTQGTLAHDSITRLIDCLANKMGEAQIHRYLPAEHYWPERSYKRALALDEEPEIAWPQQLNRPLRILLEPELISVTAPVPDYPPMNFRHRGVLHKIVKADGPERIEQEWWIQDGLHRDYYYVEDEQGNRYWLFRAGHYHHEQPVQWYLHGYCA